MTFSSEFIILNTTKIGEKSLVLHALTRELGRRSFIVSVGKSSGMSLFLPLNILEGEISENSKSDLWRVRNISAVEPLSGLRGSVAKGAMAMFMSEVLYRSIKDGSYEEGLFEWCKRSILTLDALERDFCNYHLRFLLEYAGALGFSPSVEGLAPFAGEKMQELTLLLQSDFASSMLLPLNGESRGQIAEVLLQYLRYHTDSAINVRSLSVLKELFR